MKFRIYLSMMALASCCCTSCVDLDYTEVTTNDEKWIYEKNLAGLDGLVTSIYAHIPCGIDKNYEGGTGATLAAATDEADCALSNSSVHKFYNGGWSSINPFSFAWDNSYRAIAEANNFLEKLDKIDISDYKNNNNYEALKNKVELYEYEARFLRAFFYFELIKTYGDVPFTLHSLTNAEANVMTRTPVAVVMDWIVGELDRIAEFLPITYTTELNTDVGRATRLMCLSLKARTLLYKASPLFNAENKAELWLDAARANYEVIARAEQWGVKLGKYADVWGTENGNGVEVIMASKQGAIDSWERYNYPVGVENGQSGLCPTQTLVDAYEYQGTAETFGTRHAAATIDVTAENPFEGLDPRFGMTVVKNGDSWPNYNTTPIEIFEGGLNASPLVNATQTGYYLRKYADPNVNISTNNATKSPHAWIIMRLGEFYLNYAEAMYQYYGDANTGGDFGLSANGAVNALRNRADVGMTRWNGTPADWWKRYQRERLVELAFEEHRFWDVRRWKCGDEMKEIKVVSLTKAANGGVLMTRATRKRGWNDKYYFFPIPFSELHKNPNLKQNPGWDSMN